MPRCAAADAPRRHDAPRRSGPARLRSHIDHRVVTAPTLEQGAAYVENAVGIVPQVGGEHPRMGTHNLVLRLGADVYLEVIAVNPKALPPDRPRWFELDGSLRQPRLATWVDRKSTRLNSS